MKIEFNSGNGIMGSSSRNDDPGMVWLRIYKKDHEFYVMAHTVIPELVAENKRLREVIKDFIDTVHMHSLAELDGSYRLINDGEIAQTIERAEQSLTQPEAEVKP